MSRRGEVPFVAVPVGRSQNVKEILGLAAELKIPRAQALGYRVLFEELILSDGDARTGTVKGYTVAHLVTHLGHKGDGRKLVEALKRAGWFAMHRNTFKLVDWADSITGQYAARKAEDRETWRRQKQAQKAAAAAAALGSNGVDVHLDSTWNGGGRPPVFQVENGQKERKDSTPDHPPAPALRAGELASRRWEWLLSNHKRPTNPDGCRRILGAMSAEDWAMIQWALTPGSKGGGLLSLSKKRIGRKTAYDFLRNGAYLEIRPEYLEKLRAEQRPAATPETRERQRRSEADEVAARKAGAVAFVLAQLKDDTITEAKKEAIKRKWLETHGGPGPWESGAAEGLQDAPSAN